MTPRTKSERRQFPRIKAKIPLKVAVNGYDFSTSTHNLSCIGTYCHVNKYIPPFTRISVMISLAHAGEDNLAASNSKFECKGVVVRTDDEEEGGFNIAIFFNQINNSQRQRISRYLKSHLS